ncbi:MAG: class I tRNA ligase family protein, partial [Chloroflexota bacterium]|nr:class I tRNA ligase family protein [Chloroflexota bacterium]
LHGLIRAQGGVKMSKTKGNVQDPLDLIAEYGTDALRLGVSIGITAGNDFTLTPSILDARRDFVNKLWNVGRFVQANTTAEQRRQAARAAVAGPEAPLAERWIASRLAQVIADVTRLLGEFNFGEAGRVIHDFVWDEVADWYLEAFKILARQNQADGALLAQVLDKVLRLLHPFAPFVTEELWQRLTTGLPDRPIALMLAEWPGASAVDGLALEQWGDVMALTRAARTLRSDYRIEPARAVAAVVAAPTPEQAAFWRANTVVLGSLPGTRFQPLEVLESPNGAPPELAARAISTVAGGVELLVPAEGLFDVRAETERVEREIVEARKQVQRLEVLLASDFATRAAADTVERERERLEEQRQRLSTLERRRDTLARLR